MIPKDYECEGQLNFWDILNQQDDGIGGLPDKKPYEYDFCRRKGMLVEFYDNNDGTMRIGKIVDFDEYYTEVEIDGEILVGTTHNVKYREGQLPNLDECVQEIKERHNLWCWEPKLYSIDRGYEYEYKWSHSKLTIGESHYAEGIYGGRRFVSVNWSSALEGRSRPCDTLEEVLKAVGDAIFAAEGVELEYAERRRKNARNRQQD